MVVKHSGRLFSKYIEAQNKKQPKAEEVIPTFEEEIPVVEDYNQESLLNEINTFLATYAEEEEESLGEDY